MKYSIPKPAEWRGTSAANSFGQSVLYALWEIADESLRLGEHQAVDSLRGLAEDWKDICWNMLAGQSLGSLRRDFKGWLADLKDLEIVSPIEVATAVSTIPEELERIRWGWMRLSWMAAIAVPDYEYAPKRSAELKAWSGDEGHDWPHVDAKTVLDYSDFSRGLPRIADLDMEGFSDAEVRRVRQVVRAVKDVRALLTNIPTHGGPSAYAEELEEIAEWLREAAWLLATRDCTPFVQEAGLVE